MKLAPCLLLLSLFTSCGSVSNWRELQTEPMSLGEAWNGFVQIATARDGWRADHSGIDRGVGVWQSRWKKREMERHFPIRKRLRMEVLFDGGSREDGWLLRYVIEQEKVLDLRRHTSPSEDDWSPDGQDTEGEVILGARLQRRLAPKSVQIPRPGSQGSPDRWTPRR